MDNKENVSPPPRRAAVIRIGTEVSLDEQHTALRHCPVVRMGQVQPGMVFMQEEEKVWVIPRGQCIGCGVCTRKISGKLEMLEW